jgi:hypothetical protein
MRWLTLVMLAAAAAFPTFQDPKPQEPKPVPAAAAAQQEPARPAAKPADVESVDAIVKALYDVISGPAGQKRDWDRMRSLFHADAKLLPMVRGRGAYSGMRLLPLTVDAYVQRSGPMLEGQGFFEQEIARTVQTFGDVAHVWSTYEARRAQNDEKPFLRGINSIQLVRTGGRWHVLHVLWEQEQDAGPIPAEYLPKK